jgi:hypothetical protein
VPFVRGFGRGTGRAISHESPEFCTRIRITFDHSAPDRVSWHADCENENPVPRPLIHPGPVDRRDVAVMTSGLVVLIDPDFRPQAVVEVIRAAPGLTVGDRIGAGLSVALEAADGAESERRLDRLRGLPGVAGVEVVFVHWDDTGSEVSVGS